MAKIVSELHVQLLGAFLKAVREDPRISTAHISLYVSLISLWRERSFDRPLYVFSHEIMPRCKIAGTATYHRSIKELHEYGYIKYVPSYNHFLGSLVYFVPIPSGLLLTDKRIYMRYFLLPDGENYKIMKMQPEDVQSFREKYERQILIEAESIAELLVLFSMRMERT
ncbi:MAG TPA: hypothetical protein PLL71_04260 [Agriterribacter sp.]|nr:hypothetical protein [Agriterribacter sp.]HRQ49923.1 hypothetical protein [Agriterribacter sp.]